MNRERLEEVTRRLEEDFPPRPDGGNPFQDRKVEQFFLCVVYNFERAKKAYSQFLASYGKKLEGKSTSAFLIAQIEKARSSI